MPVTVIRRTFSGSIARHCDARTSRTCEVPIPNATAPNAPCVEVWLSPQTIVMPGCVMPSSGPITWTMPCDAAVQVEEPHARLAHVPLERRQHVLRHHVGKRPPLVPRRHDVIDGRHRAVGIPHRPPSRPQHVERLRRGDLMNQVQPDEQLRLAIRQLAHRMQVPDLLEERGGHGEMGLRGPGLGARGSGLGARGSGLGARGSGLGARGSGLGARGSGGA